MKKLFLCTNKISRANIKRETVDGAEMITVTSYTLPPNIVMNGLRYSTEERNKSYETLNGTPATMGHPIVNGLFVSANDSEADFDFRFGAKNSNARITEDNRVAIDKVINVQKALKVEDGKRLLDRIYEIETNEKARPLHTSVGVYVDVVEVEPATNELGQEYSKDAINMVFDHDAFLLDEIGASTPEQGTGILTNGKDNVNVDIFMVNELTFGEISDRISAALDARSEGIKDAPYVWVRHDSIKSDSFVYEEGNKLFLSKYSIDKNDNVTIQDERVEVVRKTVYETVDSTETTTNEDDEMRTKVEKALAELGLSVNSDATEDELIDQLNGHIESLKKDDKAEITANKDLVDTVTKLTAENKGIKAELKANADEITAKKIKTITACSKYSSIPESALKLMAVNEAEDFEKMHADSIPSHSIGSTNFETNSGTVGDEMFAVNVEGDK